MVKNEAVKMISTMDENASMADIMYRLYILDKHQKAMKDIQFERVTPHHAIKNSLGVRNDASFMD